VGTRPRLICATTAALGGALTALLALLPQLHYASFSPGVRTASETTVSLVALLAAYLACGRFLRSAQLGDMLLALALVTFAATSICFGAVPTALADSSTADRLSWGATAARLGGAALFAAAALVPGAGARVRRPSLRLAAAGSTLAILALVALLEELSEHLRHRGAGHAAQVAAGPVVAAGWPVLVGQAATMVLFAAAAAGYARRSARRSDGFLSWLAVAGVLGSLAALNAVLYPSLQPGWVQVADGFRIAFYLVVLAGAGWEIQHYWTSLSQASALEERRRLARELHDGLAQEVAYIGRQARLLDPDEPAARRIAAASTRALAESRRAITLLSSGADVPLGLSFSEAIRDVAARVGVELDVVVATRRPLARDAADALTRIACEAIANAAQHGGAGRVVIELSSGARAVLRVSDDGRGFPAGEDAPERRGHGLRGMHERVAALGGDLRIVPVAGGGVRVEAVV
jgi:signal transduction histidine kinase